MLTVNGPLDQRGEIVHAEVTRRRRHDGSCINKRSNGKGRKSGTGTKSSTRMPALVGPRPDTPPNARARAKQLRQATSVFRQHFTIIIAKPSSNTTWTDSLTLPQTLCSPLIFVPLACSSLVSQYLALVYISCRYRACQSEMLKVVSLQMTFTLPHLLLTRLPF